MAWIIASVPFWLIGGIIASAALSGGYICLKKDRTGHDVQETLCGVTALLIVAGIFFIVAAKVAS